MGIPENWGYRRTLEKLNEVIAIVKESGNGVAFTQELIVNKTGVSIMTKAKTHASINRLIEGID